MQFKISGIKISERTEFWQTVDIKSQKFPPHPKKKLSSPFCDNKF